MLRRIRRSAGNLLGVLGLALSAGTAQAGQSTSLLLPPDWYPESVAVGPDGAFYVGSWRQGAIAKIDPATSEAKIFVPPGSNGLANTQGLLVDAKAKLLWVCSGTMGFTTVPMRPSALKSFDLETGAAKGDYLMPDSGYCNDVAQDEAGNIYVTDSLHPRIMRLRPGESALSVWKEDSAFSTGGEFHLNGIALDRRGRVYVSMVAAVPYLLRLDIMADGVAGSVHQIEADRLLKNADAIRVEGNDRIVIFESDAFGTDGDFGGAVSVATVSGNRLTHLRTVLAGLNQPSSGIVVAGRVYVVESKYPILLRHKGNEKAIPRDVPFDILSAPLVD